MQQVAGIQDLVTTVGMHMVLLNLFIKMVVKRNFVVFNGMLNQLMWARTICVVKGTSEITRSKNNVFSNITTIRVEQL